MLRLRRFIGFSHVKNAKIATLWIKAFFPSLNILSAYLIVKVATDEVAKAKNESFMLRFSMFARNNWFFCAWKGKAMNFSAYFIWINYIHNLPIWVFMYIKYEEIKSDAKSYCWNVNLYKFSVKNRNIFIISTIITC